MPILLKVLSLVKLIIVLAYTVTKKVKQRSISPRQTNAATVEKKAGTVVRGISPGKSKWKA